MPSLGDLVRRVCVLWCLSAVTWAAKHRGRQAAGWLPLAEASQTDAFCEIAVESRAMYAELARELVLHGESEINIKPFGRHRFA